MVADGEQDLLMKHTAKDLALMISFLAWLHLILAGLLREGYLTGLLATYPWLETVSWYLVIPDPLLVFFVLIGSFAAWSILAFLCRTKRIKPSETILRRANEPFPQQKMQKKEQGSPQTPKTDSSPSPPHDHVKIEEEWRKLEQAEKEAVRAIISQGGLWGTDIIALLEARGFTRPQATLESLTESNSFVACDHAGYHSVRPEFQAQVASVLAKDDGEEDTSDIFKKKPES